jgi:hypothetical protein
MCVKMCLNYCAIVLYDTDHNILDYVYCLGNLQFIFTQLISV